MGDDARLEGDLRRAGPRARARRGDARADPLQPHLPADLRRARRIAGVHGDGEALRDRRAREVRPARARHAAFAATRSTSSRRRTGSCSSSKAGRCRCSCGRPGSPPRSPGRGAAGDVLDPEADHRRRPALRAGRVLPGLRRHGRRIPGARRQVNELLADPAPPSSSSAGPQSEPIDEAIFFSAKLKESGLPLGAAIINRVHDLDSGELEPQASSSRRWTTTTRPARRGQLTRDYETLAERDRRSCRAAARAERRRGRAWRSWSSNPTYTTSTGLDGVASLDVRPCDDDGAAAVARLGR